MCKNAEIQEHMLLGYNYTESQMKTKEQEDRNTKGFALA